MRGVGGCMAEGWGWWGEGGAPRSADSEASLVVLLVRLQESRDFAPYEADEGAGEHLVGLPSGVLEVVVGVSQHVKKSLNQFFVLSVQEEVERERENTAVSLANTQTHCVASHNSWLWPWLSNKWEINDCSNEPKHSSQSDSRAFVCPRHT